MEIAIIFTASILIWVFIGVLLLAFLKNRLLLRKQIALSILAGILSWTLALIVKDLLPYVSRPFRINGFPSLTLIVPTDPSFPSQHTALIFGIAAYIFFRHQKLGSVYLLGAVLVAFGRVAGNVHSLFDVIGGAILGIFSALLIDVAVGSNKKRK